MTKWDMDYDGVSDNRKLTLAELDTFYWPQVFGPVDDVLSNTHHGNLPGHTDWEQHDREAEPLDRSFELVKKKRNHNLLPGTSNWYKSLY